VKIPFVDLKAQYNSIKEEIDQSIQNVIQKAAFINGEYVQSFEKTFSEYIGVKHCTSVGNGTDALFIALKSLDIGEGSEVITAANSFIATSEAITRAGAKVIFIDCDKDTYNIDINKVEEVITKNTKAIIPVHLYGHPCDMSPILKLSKKHNLYLIEDAAQAHGAKYKNQNVGTFGDIACFSFYPGKNLGAYGDGGAIVTNKEQLAMKARMYANHGRREKYEHEFEGINSRLDGLQAAILEVKLKYLEKWTERRISIARKYNEEFKGVVVTPKTIPNTRHVYHLYVIQVKNRHRVRSFLNAKGISTGIHYPLPLPFQKAYKYIGYDKEDFPVAYALKNKILSIPIHADMTKEHVEYVLFNVKQIARKH